VRVAVVTTSYPENEGDPSGHFVRAEVRALEREGHVVTVVAPRAGGAFGWPGFAARVRERPHRLFEAARWVVSAARRLRREGPFDRVVAHWSVPCAFPVALFCPGELHVVSHGGDVRLLTRAPSVLRAAIIASVVRRASVWRFVSEALRDQLLGATSDSPLNSPDARSLAALGRAGNVADFSGSLRGALLRVARVEAPLIEVPDVRARAAELRVRAGAPKALAVAVARLVATKRVDRAVAHAAERGHTLVVVGDGPERARLESLARARGADARFVGKLPREEALAWIAAADVLLHASVEEGLSTVVREAEAFGVRVERI
jgi:glycosyltransferase involved in cell wall biosynthesis